MTGPATVIGRAEVDAAKKWFAKHKQKRMDKGDDSPHYLKEYRVDFRSGIGVGVTAVCMCGKKKDVSDYDSW